MGHKRLTGAVSGALRRLLRGGTQLERAQQTFERELAKVEAARPGNRRNTLNSAAFVAGLQEARGLDRRQAEAALLAAAVRTGLTATEARKTILAAMADGRARATEPSPRSAPRRQAATRDPRGSPVEIAADLEPAAMTRRDKAKQMWAAGVPAHGTPAEIYLRQRGLVGCIPDALRFGARVRMPDELTYPCLLAAITVPTTGELLAVHRIALREDGTAKASIEDPKATLGSSRGGAVVLGSIDAATPVVLEGEGIETVLSAVQATGWPGIATLSSTTLGRPPLPAGCKVTLLVDRGAEDAASAGAERRRQEKRVVHLAHVPSDVREGKTGKDVNDVLQLRGLEAVRAMITVAQLFEAPYRPADVPEGFRRRHDGSIEYCSGADDEGWQYLCSPIEILAMTRDTQGKAWGRLVRVQNPDGKWSEVNLPLRLFAGNGEAVRAALHDRGLDLPSHRAVRAKFTELIMRSQPSRRILCTARLGWHDTSFVLPDGAIGASGQERIVFQSEEPLEHAFRVRGSLEGWQQAIGRRAAGNSRLVFTISSAFAAPLLTPLQLEGGGFHIWGRTSAGKTTLMQVAGSVCGGGDGPDGYLRRWRATANGLEGVAALHNDNLLCLDELAEADADSSFEMLYMLANGQGKQRSNLSLGARAPQRWRVLILSTGEIQIGDKIKERGRHITGGQQVRMVDLEADAGAGLGVFEDLHDAQSAAEFAEELKSAAASHYGHPLRAFLEVMTDDPDHAQAFARKIIDQFIAREQNEARSPTEGRILKRFALVAAAGELAVRHGIVPWQPDEALQAVERCWRDRLAASRGAHERQVCRAIEQVRGFLQMHGTSRFAPLTDANRPAQDRAGFYEDAPDGRRTYWIFPEQWQLAVCAGLDSRWVARTLAERGALLTDHGIIQVRKTVPGGGRRRFYAVKSAIDDL